MPRTCPWGSFAACWGLLIALVTTAAGQELSHARLRPAHRPSQRPLAAGPSSFVHPTTGDDAASGSKDAPWRTIQHALSQIQAGQTLYLRGGVYYENVFVALDGLPKAPITIRGYPGEVAVIDGGFSEFFDSPDEAWQPVEGSNLGEYRSTKRYPNLRNVVGSFGDSMIGLQTYYHAKDLRSTSELVDWEDWERTAETDLKPLYCGPGMWHDRATGYIHARLAHTHLPEPIDNYQGPTDPRKLPLVIARFNSIPLNVDRAHHLRFQDLVIRGSGYRAIRLDQCTHIDFDNVTVWCGTYGIEASGAQHMTFVGSALYGNVAPWTFRGDGSKRDYPGRPHRNISRLNTHSLIEINSGRESSVYAFPQNDHWEIAYSEFTDAHDALYLGGINVHFHHNLIENMQDDGIYLSPMYLRHRLDQQDPQVHIYQNIFRQLLTALAFGGSEPIARDHIFIYRNLFDLRQRVNTGRPSVRRTEPGFATGNLMGDHGSPPWPSMNFYHNTVVAQGPARFAAMGAMGHSRPEYERRVWNNIFYHVARLPGFYPPDPTNHVIADGNLYWSPATPDLTAEQFFGRFRSSPQFTESKAIYEPGSTTNSLVADPKFLKVADSENRENDYRLAKPSPAVDAGVPVSTDWLDPYRADDQGKPDLGAFPLGASPLKVGREARPVVK